MSDMTQEQIFEEFKRQVRLCKGIGPDAMLSALEEQFGPHTCLSSPISQTAERELIDRLRGLLQLPLDRMLFDAVVEILADARHMRVLEVENEKLAQRLKDAQTVLRGRG